jgi:hypothetical protein
MIKLVEMPEGYCAYRDNLKLAVITTKQHNIAREGSSMTGEEIKAFKAGVVVWEAMPFASWSIHFTSPTMSVHDFLEIAAALPKE